MKDKGLKSAFDYLHCFVLGSGLYKNKEFVKLKSKFQDNKEKSIEIDLSKFLPELQNLYVNDLMQTNDANEGILSFLQKRQAAWKNE